MGCQYYNFQRWVDKGESGDWKDISFHFSQAEQGFGCLCTWPHDHPNYEERMDVDDLRSLALLGAAVVLAHAGKIESRDDTIFPSDIPKWFIDELNRLLPPSDG